MQMCIFETIPSKISELVPKLAEGDATDKGELYVQIWTFHAISNIIFSVNGPSNPCGFVKFVKVHFLFRTELFMQLPSKHCQ